jgi:hypothetical protein
MDVTRINWLFSQLQGIHRSQLSASSGLSSVEMSLSPKIMPTPMWLAFYDLSWTYEKPVRTFDMSGHQPCQYISVRMSASDIPQGWSEHLCQVLHNSSTSAQF